MFERSIFFIPNMIFWQCAFTITGLFNNKNIPFVVLVGADEIQTGKLTLKNMQTGEQDKLPIDKIIEKIIGISN